MLMEKENIYKKCKYFLNTLNIESGNIFRKLWTLQLGFSNGIY